MAFWSTLTKLFARTGDVSSLQQPSPWLMSWAGGGQTTAGLYVSPQGAMALACYYDCIRIISEDLAKLPLMVYERLEPRGKRVAKEHPLYPILHDAPNDDMTSMTVRETLTHHMLGWGNGYAEILRTGRGQVEGLMPLHPSRVALREDENGQVVYDVYGSNGLTGAQATGWRRVAAVNMLHVHGLGPDGYTGYSVAQLAAESLGLSMAADRFGASFFGDDATPSGILTHPARLSQPALDNLRKSWEERHQGSRKMAVLEEGMQWETLTIPPEQGQFIETRQFQTLEICRWFRISPVKVGVLEHATYNNIEQEAINHWTDCIMPWAVRWEQELKRKLFVDEPDFFAEHAIQAQMRGDQAARAQFYKELFGMGSLSPNDIRDFENLQQIPEADGGDATFIAANNFRTLKSVIQESEAPPEEEDPSSAFIPSVPGQNGARGALHD